jgi:hypothetical protein
MKYDRNASELWQIDAEKHLQAAEREADRWTFWCCVGIVFLLFYMGAI